MTISALWPLTFIENYWNKLGARAPSLLLATQLCLERNLLNIVETGTSRIENNFGGDGLSTIIFGHLVKLYDGRVWTCDILPDHIEICKKITSEYSDNITYVVSDSVEFLRLHGRLIDLLYLDSMDFAIGSDPNPPQTHCVNEYLAAKDKLTDQSVIVIDDCLLPHGGKGGKLIPILEAEGWKGVYKGYQTVWVRK